MTRIEQIAKIINDAPEGISLRNIWAQMPDVGFGTMRGYVRQTAAKHGFVAMGGGASSLWTTQAKAQAIAYRAAINGRQRFLDRKKRENAAYKAKLQAAGRTREEGLGTGKKKPVWSLVPSSVFDLGAKL